MPAAATKDIRTKLRLPMLPKDWMNRLASCSTPSRGRSNASGGARTIGTPWLISALVSRRSTLPCVICGNGRLETINATMVTGTASASSATIALATLDQVSERMPPAMTMAVAHVTTTATIRRSDCPSSQAAA